MNMVLSGKLMTRTCHALGVQERFPCFTAGRSYADKRQDLEL